MIEEDIHSLAGSYFEELFTQRRAKIVMKKMTNNQLTQYTYHEMLITQTAGEFPSGNK